ncbi:NmrA family NAD(P)-binding protein [Croceicoccus mobilis]|uniref:NmrA-like domain-containing protein n=1 Tax=Croceicoccus mobilis TaxID=1703339 RepID=A0A916Z3D7_9SPHN|nr:NAD(P)H-binding protein [Croceicoccus mobilis]GGD74969.1 hypothetical protein GCM10010990_25750 [Croceicoccus mobilis]
MAIHEKFRRDPLRSVAIFGASGRMGREVADFLSYAAPDLELRLIASSASSQEKVAGQFPHAKVVNANYFDAPSLEGALAGVEGVFVVTPPGLDEKTAMPNVVAALKQAGSVRQVIRLLGYAPDYNPKKFPWGELKTGWEHWVAREIFDESGLPMTYVNLGATLFDNFYFTRPALVSQKKLIWPDRHLPMFDVRDLGEVVARLFLSPDQRYVGTSLTMNNGYDYVTTAQMAEAMSDAWRVRISVDTSREAFLKEYCPVFEQRFGHAGMAEGLLDYFEWEHENWLWQINDTAERILGRKPNTLFGWLREHKSDFVDN